MTMSGRSHSRRHPRRRHTGADTHTRGHSTHNTHSDTQANNALSAPHWQTASLPPPHTDSNLRQEVGDRGIPRCWCAASTPPGRRTKGAPLITRRRAAGVGDVNGLGLGTVSGVCSHMHRHNNP